MFSNVLPVRDCFGVSAASFACFGVSAREDLAAFGVSQGASALRFAALRARKACETASDLRYVSKLVIIE